MFRIWTPLRMVRIVGSASASLAKLLGPLRFYAGKFGDAPILGFQLPD